MGSPRTRFRQVQPTLSLTRKIDWGRVLIAMHRTTFWMPHARRRQHRPVPLCARSDSELISTMGRRSPRHMSCTRCPTSSGSGAGQLYPYPSRRSLLALPACSGANRIAYAVFHVDLLRTAIDVEFRDVCRDDGGVV